MNTSDDIVVLNEKKGNVEHVVNKVNGDAGAIYNGNVDGNTDDVADNADNVANAAYNVGYNEDSPSVKSNSDSNCHIISAEIHKENDLTAYVVSRDVSVAEDEEGDSVVDIVNNVENKYAPNGDMVKRASHVSYKSHAKNRVSMLIHRHTL